MRILIVVPLSPIMIGPVFRMIFPEPFSSSALQLLELLLVPVRSMQVPRPLPEMNSYYEGTVKVIIL